MFTRPLLVFQTSLMVTLFLVVPPLKQSFSVNSPFDNSLTGH